MEIPLGADHFGSLLVPVLQRLSHQTIMVDRHRDLDALVETRNHRKQAKCRNLTSLTKTKNRIYLYTHIC